MAGFEHLQEGFRNEGHQQTSSNRGFSGLLQGSASKSRVVARAEVIGNPKIVALPRSFGRKQRHDGVAHELSVRFFEDLRLLAELWAK